MDTQISETIRTIEAEICMEYSSRAINWVDKNLNNAWSNAIDRYERILVLVYERHEYTLLKAESEFYRKTVLDLLRKYKEAKRIDDSEAFLQTLKTQGGK